MDGRVTDNNPSHGLNKVAMGYEKIVAKIEKVVNLICVIALTIQTITMIVTVIGRYVFKYVPLGAEDLALFCMVWFSLLGICLNIRDDKHIKVEILDAVLKSQRKLKYIRIFAIIAIAIFSIFMVIKGISIIKLTAVSTMSGLRISMGWLYLSLPLGGLTLFLSSLSVLLNLIGGRDNGH